MYFLFLKQLYSDFTLLLVRPTKIAYVKFFVKTVLRPICQYLICSETKYSAVHAFCLAVQLLFLGFHRWLKDKERLENYKLQQISPG